MNPYWISVTGSELMQGDLLPGCQVPIVQDDFNPSARPIDVTIRQVDLIVLTLSCDLANLKSGLVALCPAYTIPLFESVNPSFRKKGAWEEVRKGRREGLHLLASPVAPDSNRDALVLNFREIFSLPIGYLRTRAVAAGTRWRLQSPFLEHYSQSFARFFMRVGLPSALPPFVD